ncbi:DUF421 domain-containing protein [[Clostridium] cellulosi]
MGIAFIRTVILYVLVVAAVRIMGKRQIGELQPSELVVAILISELAAIPMQETGTPLSSGIIPILTLIACEVILSALTLSSIKLRHIISGKPSILIKDGQIDQREMKRLRFTVDDLMEELRNSGYMNLDEIAYAVLETNGKLSVFPKCENKPVTAGMMNIKCEDTGLPTMLICDGILSLPSLAGVGKDMVWLEDTLTKQGLTPEDVFIMTIDKSEKTIIIPKDKT